MGEMKRRLDGAKLIVSRTPKVVVTLEEVMCNPRDEFKPTLFSLRDLRLQILLDVSGTAAELENLEPVNADVSLMKTIMGKIGVTQKESHKLRLCAIVGFMKEYNDEEVVVSVTKFKEGEEEFLRVLSSARARALIEEAVSKMASQVIADMMLDDSHELDEKSESDLDSPRDSISVQGRTRKVGFALGTIPRESTGFRSQHGSRTGGLSSRESSPDHFASTLQRAAESPSHPFAPAQQTARLMNGRSIAHSAMAPRSRACPSAGSLPADVPSAYPSGSDPAAPLSKPGDLGIYGNFLDT